MNFGDSIRRIREQRGLTQQQIADVIGTHRSNYSKIEKGQREISVAAIIKVAKHFDITVDQLLNLDNDDKATSSKVDLDTKLNLVQGLSKEDREVVYRVIDLLLTEKAVKAANQAK